MPLDEPNSGAPHRWRELVVPVALVLLVLLALSDRTHAALTHAVTVGTTFIQQHPKSGLLAFVVLSAASAMVAFFSSVPLIPVAVEAWGQESTAALLWAAWWLGGVVTYGLGRGFGVRVARQAVSESTMDRYARVLKERAGLGTILVFQMALPSEIPGYVLGTLRYPFGTYALALALAELPYALSGVFLSEGFLQRQYLVLALAGGGLVLLSTWALARLRRTLRDHDQTPPRQPNDQLPGNGV